MDTKELPGTLRRGNTEFYRSVPSKKEAVRFLDDLVSLLFPVTRECRLSDADMEYCWQDLRLRFAKLIEPVLPAETDSMELAGHFFAEIPAIHDSLMDDAVMFDECDPASFCKEEIILCYPGFYAIMIHRFAHIVHGLGVPILPRMFSEHAHSLTGIDIHPGATIGRNFYIDHGTGIVIGETSVIGNNVKIYQGVTLGATFVDKNLKGKKRHPEIEDNVIIYAGSTILGGGTVVGHDTVIGGNVWLTESVPPFSTVYHRPEIVIKEGAQKK